MESQQVTYPLTLHRSRGRERDVQSPRRVLRLWERRGWRRLVWIARKANTEPVETLLSLAMELGGWALVTRPETASSPLLFPVIFGWALCLFGLCGFWGIWTRNAVFRAAFGFGGVFVGMWMALLYGMSNHHDPAWIAFATGAVALAWVSIRVVCDATARRTRRNQQ